MSLNPDPTAHFVVHRNALELVRQRLAALRASYESLEKVREHNPLAVQAMRTSRGDVAGRRCEEMLLTDAILARQLLEPLSGTAIGKLIRSHARVIDNYPQNQPLDAA